MGQNGQIIGPAFGEPDGEGRGPAGLPLARRLSVDYRRVLVTTFLALSKIINDFFKYQASC